MILVMYGHDLVSKLLVIIKKTISSALLLFLFTGHVIKTKTRNLSVNKVKILGSGR